MSIFFAYYLPIRQEKNKEFTHLISGHFADFVEGGILMVCHVGDLRYKDVVNIKNGIRIGCVDDVEINTCTAEVTALVIYGRRKLFGLLGREEDIIIRWQDIDVIGEDTILVCFEGVMRSFGNKKPGSFLNRLFG